MFQYLTHDDMCAKVHVFAVWGPSSGILAHDFCKYFLSHIAYLYVELARDHDTDADGALPVHVSLSSEPSPSHMPDMCRLPVPPAPACSTRLEVETDTAMCQVD